MNTKTHIIILYLVMSFWGVLNLANTVSIKSEMDTIRGLQQGIQQANKEIFVTLAELQETLKTPKGSIVFMKGNK
jgi:hypothetical protein